MFTHPIPLSLYIHIPWCIRKCPYCDFNSHARQAELPENQYIDRLLEEIAFHLPWLHKRTIHSIFIGGGTPSLFSAAAYQKLFQSLRKQLVFENNIEITLEANPGTVEQERFFGYRETGINRLSIGIQSFNDEKLQSLGRIHNGDEAQKAIQIARKAGFDNCNLDLMFGLPNQKLDEALSDLQTAIDCKPTHISWYQLTLEPNTYFYKFPPTLPDEDHIWSIQEAGQQLLQENGFIQYEISAYSQLNFSCQHNVNYWEFGDYLGIGAGAHSKLTDMSSGVITRHWNVKSPTFYLDPHQSPCERRVQLTAQELPLEFMMNALRLRKLIPHDLFTQRTGLSTHTIASILAIATQQHLLYPHQQYFEPSPLGHRFLNDLLELFM